MDADSDSNGGDYSDNDNGGDDVIMIMTDCYNESGDRVGV